MSEVCPWCSKKVRTVVPAGGDGSAQVYVRHDAIRGPGWSERCRGSRHLVDTNLIPPPRALRKRHRAAPKDVPRQNAPGHGKNPAKARRKMPWKTLDANLRAALVRVSRGKHSKLNPSQRETLRYLVVVVTVLHRLRSSGETVEQWIDAIESGEDGIIRWLAEIVAGERR